MRLTEDRLFFKRRDDLDNAEDIQARVLEIEHRILPKAVALFCDGKIIVENERAKVI